MDWGADMSTVPVARGLLFEILKDGTCPLHVRMELQKALQEESSLKPESKTLLAKIPLEVEAEVHQEIVHEKGAHATPRLDSGEVQALGSELQATEQCAPHKAGDETDKEAITDDSLLLERKRTPLETAVERSKEEMLDGCSLLGQLPVAAGRRRNEDALDLCELPSPCLLRVAAQLPLVELLAARTCSRRCLTCFTQRALPEFDEMERVQNRIRARLWLERVVALTKDTIDETVFDTQVRSFANDALRRRMEAEMAEAKVDMERQIHAFQLDVDRRMEEQAQRVHAIIEERVHQQVEMILSAEMEKVRVMAEERVQERVRTVLQEEVLATVREMQARLTTLAQENEQLRNAFAEHLDHSDLCYRSLVWALSPNATGFFARTLRFVWCCRRRLTKFSAQLLGVPPDRRKERLRMRLEALRRALDSDENLRARLTSADGNAVGQLQAGANGEAGNEGSLPPMARPLMALMAAAQSADLTGDVNSINSVQPTDLAVGSSISPGDFSVAESASATATVIAAALLLASQANRRNAGGESGRSGTVEPSLNGEEGQMQALPDNPTATIEEVPIESVDTLPASTAEEAQTSLPENISDTSVKADEVASPIAGDSTASAATDMEQRVECEIAREVNEQVSATIAATSEVASSPDQACQDEMVSLAENPVPESSSSSAVDAEVAQVEHAGKSYDEVAEATASAAMEAAMEELVQEANEEAPGQQQDNAANSESGSVGGGCHLEEISEWGQEEGEEEDLAFALRDLPVDTTQNDAYSDEDEEDDTEARDPVENEAEELFFDLPEDDEDCIPIIYETPSEWDGEMLEETFAETFQADGTSLPSTEQFSEEKTQIEDTCLHPAEQCSEEMLHESAQSQVSQSESSQPELHSSSHESPQPCGHVEESRDVEVAVEQVPHSVVVVSAG